MLEFYPLLDFAGAPLLAIAFAILFLTEKLRPLRRRMQTWLQRLWTNLVVAAPAFLVLRLALIPAIVGVAALAEHADFGLVRWMDLPEPFVAGICWDRLHRTLRLDVPQDQAVIGVPDYRDPKELTIAQLLLMPFRAPRSPPPRDREHPSDRKSAERKNLAP